MIIVSDTSPVRGLLAIGRIIILQQLFNKVLLPQAVKEELLRVGALKQETAEFIVQAWVEVKAIKVTEDYYALRKILDAGESEAIILARQYGADMLLMDESKGRRLAQEMNVKVLGLIGVLIKAKKAALITALKPELDKLVFEHGFWIQKDLYRNILKAADE